MLTLYVITVIVSFLTCVLGFNLGAKRGETLVMSDFLLVLLINVIPLANLIVAGLWLVESLERRGTFTKFLEIVVLRK